MAARANRMFFPSRRQIVTYLLNNPITSRIDRKILKVVAKKFADKEVPNIQIYINVKESFENLRLFQSSQAVNLFPLFVCLVSALNQCGENYSHIKKYST